MQRAGHHWPQRSVERLATAQQRIAPSTVWMAPKTADAVPATPRVQTPSLCTGNLSPDHPVRHLDNARLSNFRVQVGCQVSEFIH
jgi:hypothetical protein